MSRTNVLRRWSTAPAKTWTSVFGGARLRTVPAAVVEGSELVHLGGGETVPCPGIDALPMAPGARRLGLGSPSLALPPAKVHVLRNVKLCPGSRLVTTMSGKVVAESMTADMAGRAEVCDEELKATPIRVDGTIALFRSPWQPQFHTLVDHLPRAALLAQPAMRHIGPVTLVHDGPLSDTERQLLPRLLGRHIRLLEVEAGTPITADRVLLPSYVTRPYAGAIPSWYRRWLDREFATVRLADADLAGGRRRYFIDRTGGDRQVTNRADLDRVLERHNITTIRPSAMPVQERIVRFRDAELVIGVIGSGMSNLLYSREARVVELLPGQEVLPHFYYLAASKGLPYEYLAAPDDGHYIAAEDRLHRDVTVNTEALDAMLRELV
ncbi:hypothetical protein BH10ACT3_BH10ACT3_11570 [soil metagenome]